MRRCKHESAKLIDGPLALRANRQERTNLVRVHAYCEACELGWIGYHKPWLTQQGNIHKPPKWVERLVEIERETVNEIEEV